MNSSEVKKKSLKRLPSADIDIPITTTNSSWSVMTLEPGEIFQETISRDLCNDKQDEFSIQLIRKNRLF